MKKDNRQIRLDPMEWRDAMRDVTGGATRDVPPKKKSGVKKKAAAKPSGTRR